MTERQGWKAVRSGMMSSLPLPSSFRDASAHTGRGSCARIDATASGGPSAVFLSELRPYAGVRRRHGPRYVGRAAFPGSLRPCDGHDRLTRGRAQPASWTGRYVPERAGRNGSATSSPPAGSSSRCSRRATSPARCAARSGTPSNSGPSTTAPAPTSPPRPSSRPSGYRCHRANCPAPPNGCSSTTVISGNGTSATASTV